jgi:hypothetical protein
VTVQPSSALPERPATAAATTSAIVSAFSLGAIRLGNGHAKSAKLALTPHHLFYLLSRFEELAIPVGPMKIRLENLHDSSTAPNYVSFLSGSSRSRSRDADGGSIHSVSSVRSVMSGMSALWASFGIGASLSAARTERQKAALAADLKYLYSAFTKIPCLRLAPDRRARLIRGYEEFPFDSAVPLHVFKNVQSLEVMSLDFRQFFGWDRMADQLRSLSLRRAGVEDAADILVDIVLDDMDKRRRRTSKAQQQQPSPTSSWPANVSPRRSYSMQHPELRKSMSMPNSPDPRHGGAAVDPRSSLADLRAGSLPLVEHAVDDSPSRRTSVAGSTVVTPTSSSVAIDTHHASPDTPTSRSRRSTSPPRPTSSRTQTAPARASYQSHHRMRRSGSGSSQSSTLSDSWHRAAGSSGNLLHTILPPNKWRFLRHFGLPDNSLTSISASSLAPLANTVHSIDLSSNLFVQIPDSLATLTNLRALNLAHCMIDSLQSLTRNPLPAITALNLRGNRLQSLAGIERLLPLERLDLRDNALTDPLEIARLTSIPDIREIWLDGNPFVRSHRATYRITIFNLFRSCPGYTEDPLIDGSGPSYSEKRQLIDRVPMPAAVPVVKVPAAQPMAVDVVGSMSATGAPRHAASQPTLVRKERPIPRPTASDSAAAAVTASRRRKAPKRRVVDLATSSTDLSLQALQSLQPGSVSESEDNYRFSTSQDHADVVGSTVPAPETPRIEAGMPLVYDTTSRQVWVDVEHELKETASAAVDQTPTDWDANADIFRRKIEALRDKVGTGYLSVLSGEDGWDSRANGAGAAGVYGVPDALRTSTATLRPITPASAVKVAVATRPPTAITSGRT